MRNLSPAILIATYIATRKTTAPSRAERRGAVEDPRDRTMRLRLWMRVGLQRGTPQGEDKQRRDRRTDRQRERDRACARSLDAGGGLLLLLPTRVIEMQREVISGLSLGQLPFCNLRFPNPFHTVQDTASPPLIYQTVLTSLAIITPLHHHSPINRLPRLLLIPLRGLFARRQEENRLFFHTFRRPFRSRWNWMAGWNKIGKEVRI